MSDIYLQFKEKINELIKKDSRYINLSLQDKTKIQEYILKLLNNYLQQTDFLNGKINIEKKSNFDFILGLLKDPKEEQTVIVDYSNLENFVKDSINSLERLLFVFNWAKYFNIKNIIIVSKKDIYKDIQELIQKKQIDLDNNIIIINTHGISNLSNLEIDNDIGKDIFNSMTSNDDSLCLIIIQKLNQSKIPRKNIFLLTADMKMLEENYSYIPPFTVSYQNINNGIIESNNNRFLMDTLKIPFYNQTNYNEYLRHLDEHYILEPITINLIESLYNNKDIKHSEEYYRKKYYKYKIKYQELLKQINI